MTDVTIRADTPLPEIKRLAPPCSCGACRHGCTMGSGFLVESDHTKLASYLDVSEDGLKERYLEPEEKFHTTLWRPRIKKNSKGFGPCIFYDGKSGCTVHDAKPTHCQIAMGCKDYGEDLSVWFHVNHFVDKDDPESIRQFATYLASGGKTIPGAQLRDLAPDVYIREKMLDYRILTREDLEHERKERDRSQDIQNQA